MTVPEIERMGSEIITDRLDMVKANLDLITKVETREDVVPDAYTKIHVTFSYLKRVTPMGGSEI